MSAEYLIVAEQPESIAPDSPPVPIAVVEVERVGQESEAVSAGIEQARIRGRLLAHGTVYRALRWDSAARYGPSSGIEEIPATDEKEE